MSRFTRWVWCVTVVVATTALVGCGSSSHSTTTSGSGSSSAATTTPAATTAAASSAVVAGKTGGKVPAETIGIVNVAATSQVALDCQTQTVAAAKALGWTTKVLDAAGNPASMASDVSSLVTQGVSAIVNVAVPPQAAAQGLAAAAQKGIPTMQTCNTPANQPPYAASYGPSNTADAGFISQFMADDLGGKGTVVAEFESANPAVNSEDAVFLTVMKTFGIKVVATHQVNLANGTPDVMSSTLAMIRAHPGVTGEFVDIDQDFAPAVQAIVQNHLNVKVYGTSGEQQALAALRTYPTVARGIGAYDAGQSGWTAIDQLLHFFVNHTPIDPTAGWDYPYPVTVVTHANAPANLNGLFQNYGAIYLPLWKQEGYQF